MKILLLSFVFFLSFFIQKPIAQSTIIDQYITEAISNSNALKQQSFSIEKSIIQLEESKRVFLPTINFNTTYSTAAGGRRLSFPIGDLVNPIYSNLNRLNPAGVAKYPEGAIPNVNEQLVPKNFYDMRIKTQMPIFNVELKYFKKIKSQLLDVQYAEKEVFKRELVKEIKIGYFNYLKALEALNIYENIKILLKETERVNISLIKNEMANTMVLVKTKNEQAKIEADAIAAENNKQNAQTYFNYLLNNTYNTEILVDSTIKNKLGNNIAIINDINNREELKKINAAIVVNETILAMNKSFYKPKIGGILDVGSQGKVSAIEGKNAFVLLGLSFDLPIYTGNRNKLKIKEQEMELASLNEQENILRNQLLLQTEVAKNTFNTSIKIIDAKEIQIITAKRYYGDVLKKYKEGQSNYPELLEALTQFSNSLLQKNIAFYDSWIRFAELERANASFELK